MKFGYMGNGWSYGHGWRNMFRIKRGMVGFDKDLRRIYGWSVSLLGFTFILFDDKNG